jgi:hypothetical protein
MLQHATALLEPLQEPHLATIASHKLLLLPVLIVPPNFPLPTPPSYCRCPSAQGRATVAVMLPTSTIDWQATKRQGGLVTAQPQTIRLLLHELGHALHFVAASAAPADPMPTSMRLDGLEVPSHLAQRAATDPVALKVCHVRLTCWVCRVAYHNKAQVTELTCSAWCCSRHS